MTLFVRPNIAQMEGYVPGEQPQTGGFIKLNTNENPYPPSPRVKAAIAEAVTDRLRLYPDPMSSAFRRTVGELHGLDPEMVLAGNGSDDLLTIITRAFVGPGDLAAFASPSYLLYATLVALQDGKPLVVPYAEDSTLDLHAFGVPGLKVCYLANPDSPLGTAQHSRRDRSPGGDPRLRAGGRRGLCRFRRFAVSRAGAGQRPSQPDRYALIQQGLQPRRDQAGVPGRSARACRGAREAQGFVQLRCARARPRVSPP